MLLSRQIWRDSGINARINNNIIINVKAIIITKIKGNIINILINLILALMLRLSLYYHLLFKDAVYILVVILLI